MQLNSLLTPQANYKDNNFVIIIILVDQMVISKGMNSIYLLFNIVVKIIYYPDVLKV